MPRLHSTSAPSEQALRLDRAGVGRPSRAALATSTPMDAAAPDAYGIAWTQALAVRQGERPQRAFDALADRAGRNPTRPTRSRSSTRCGCPCSRTCLRAAVGVLRFGRHRNPQRRDRRQPAPQRSLARCCRRHQRAHSTPVAGPFAPLRGGDSIDERRGRRPALRARRPTSRSKACASDVPHLDDDRRHDRRRDHRPDGVHRTARATPFATCSPPSAIASRIRRARCPRRDAQRASCRDLTLTPTLRDTLAGASPRSLQRRQQSSRQSILPTVAMRPGAADHVDADVGLPGASGCRHPTNPRHGLLQPGATTSASHRRCRRYFACRRGRWRCRCRLPLGVQRDEILRWLEARDRRRTPNADAWASSATGSCSPTAAYSERLNEFGRYTGHRRPADALSLLRIPANRCPYAPCVRNDRLTSARAAPGRRRRAPAATGSLPLRTTTP